MRHTLVLLAAIALFTSCQELESPGFGIAGVGVEMEKSANADAYSDDIEADVTENLPEVERKLIKEGNVRFETDEISKTRETVLAAAEKHKAYVSSDEEYKYSGSISNTIVLRVPADNFDALLQDATVGISKFDNKQINVRDVTEEFLDISARIKTKKELEARYLSLLDKATTVTEILEIEKQVGELRSEIESIEGRLKYLQNRVSFSTLTINFYESVPVPPKFSGKFSKGFRNGWNNLVWFVIGLINIWPFWILAITLVIFIRKWRKKRRMK